MRRLGIVFVLNSYTYTRNCLSLLNIICPQDNSVRRYFVKVRQLYIVESSFLLFIEPLKRYHLYFFLLNEPRTLDEKMSRCLVQESFGYSFIIHLPGVNLNYSYHNGSRFINFDTSGRFNEMQIGLEGTLVFKIFNRRCYLTLIIILNVMAHLVFYKLFNSFFNFFEFYATKFFNK